MKRFVLLAFAAFIAAGSAIHAQQVTLRDGTVFDGYVSQQSRTGDACITYTAACYTVPGESVKLTRHDDACDIFWDGSTYRGVEILEEGDLVTFRVNVEGKVDIKVADIERIAYNPTPGVHDVVVAGESYEGVIVENIVGKYIKLEMSGRKVVLAKNKITSQSKVSADKSKMLNIKLFPYLEEYEVEDMPKMTGVLVSTNNKDGSAILMGTDGTMIPISIGKIVSTKRIPNEAYDKPDEEQQPVDILVCGRAPKWMAVSTDYWGDYTIRASALAENITPVFGDYIYINSAEDRPSLQLVPFDPFSPRNDNLSFGSSDDLNFHAIQASSVVATQGRQDTEFAGLEQGFYILWDIAERRVAPIWVLP